MLGDVVPQRSSIHEGNEHEFFFLAKKTEPGFEYSWVPGECLKMDRPVLLLFENEVGDIWFDEVDIYSVEVFGSDFKILLCLE